MRALVLSGPGDLSVRDVTEAPLHRGELRIAISFAGICGTDLRLYRGTKVIGYPRIIGHEMVGRVVEVADPATGWAVGDRVAVYPTVACGQCYACLADRKNICVNRRTLGYEWDGGFADTMVVPAEAVAGGNVLLLPDDLPDEDAAASEPVAAAYQGILRGGVGPGSQVLIIGGGPIGLAHVQLSRLAGAETIVVSEPEASRRAAARALGADAIVDPGTQSLTDGVSAVFGATGPDIAFIDVGVPSLVGEVISVLRKGARCVLFAGMAEGATSVLEPNTIHYREIDLVGSSSSTPENQAEVLRLASRGDLSLRALVSRVLPLEAWAEGFAMKDRAEGIKVLLDFGAGVGR